ncbi:hypothetical protein [Kitasatospora viridis]|uniref:hypothetical protein n=1 Tax=Kitasatospora viridis TaxID=281105 RepID=UPI0031E21AA8
MAVAFLVGVVGLLTAVGALRAAAKAERRARAAVAQAAAARGQLTVAGPPRVALTKAAAPRPVPVGRDTLLAVVHLQLAELERRRRHGQRPAPVDAVPRAYQDTLRRLKEAAAAASDSPTDAGRREA